MSKADANCTIGTEMSGVSGNFYTLNSCARHEKSACSLRIS